LAAEDIERTAATVAQLANRARADGAATLAVVGTLCLRRAANAGAFADTLERRAGLRVEILTGAQEARLGHLGATGSLGELPARRATFDIGGGSTEVVAADVRRDAGALSLEIGTLAPTLRLQARDPVPADVLAAVDAGLAAAVAAARPLLVERTLVGVGGTAATLAALDVGRWRGAAAALHGRSVARALLERLIVRVAALPLAARRRLPGLPADRADVILAGALLARHIVRLAGADGFTVSVHDLRQGVLAQRYGAGPVRLDPAADPP
jgi:exopolyphosphatase/guanosine-5'-triphosphate,3'-diphosphate pyrophosphatase